nr:uncharacterized protein LOC113828589 [Penaeus vannamei]
MVVRNNRLILLHGNTLISFLEPKASRGFTQRRQHRLYKQREPRGDFSVQATSLACCVTRSSFSLSQKMRVVAAFVWAVAGAWALEEGGVGSLYDQHFPPLHPNCTQSLTDLLLRQESQLRESAGILKEILSETKGSLATEASCSGTFLKFGGTCLYLAKDVKKLGMLLGPSARTWERLGRVPRRQRTRRGYWIR